ncbi:hypothetical protein [Lysinibacillus sp. TE18511]
MHTHFLPLGDSAPSPEDIEVTERLADAGRLRESHAFKRNILEYFFEYYAINIRKKRFLN